MTVVTLDDVCSFCAKQYASSDLSPASAKSPDKNITTSPNNNNENESNNSIAENGSSFAQDQNVIGPGLQIKLVSRPKTFIANDMRTSFPAGPAPVSPSPTETQLSSIVEGELTPSSINTLQPSLLPRHHPGTRRDRPRPSSSALPPSDLLLKSIQPLQSIITSPVKVLTKPLKLADQATDMVKRGKEKQKAEDIDPQYLASWSIPSIHFNDVGFLHLDPFLSDRNRIVKQKIGNEVRTQLLLDSPSLDPGEDSTIAHQGSQSRSNSDLPGSKSSTSPSGIAGGPGSSQSGLNLDPLLPRVTRSRTRVGSWIKDLRRCGNDLGEKIAELKERYQEPKMRPGECCEDYMIGHELRKVRFADVSEQRRAEHCALKKKQEAVLARKRAAALRIVGIGCQSQV